MFHPWVMFFFWERYSSKSVVFSIRQVLYAGWIVLCALEFLKLVLLGNAKSLHVKWLISAWQGNHMLDLFIYFFSFLPAPSSQLITVPARLSRQKSIAKSIQLEERRAAAKFRQQDIKDRSKIMQLSPSYMLILLCLLSLNHRRSLSIHCLSLSLCEDNCELNQTPFFFLSVLPHRFNTEYNNNKITVEGARKIIQLSHHIILNTSKLCIKALVDDKHNEVQFTPSRYAPSSRSRYNPSFSSQWFVPPPRPCTDINQWAVLPGTRWLQICRLTFASAACISRERSLLVPDWSEWVHTSLLATLAPSRPTSKGRIHPLTGNGARAFL